MHHISDKHLAAVTVMYHCKSKESNKISEGNVHWVRRMKGTQAVLLSPQCHKKPFWRVEPSEGEVPPESQLELKVVAHLKDTLLFQARLEVSIRDSQTLHIPLSATGTGTTVISDKPFAPSLELGTYLR